MCKGSYVRITLSYSNFLDLTNSITDTPDIEAQLLEWQVTLHLYAGQHVQVWGNGCTCYFLTQHWGNLRDPAEER